MLSVRAMTVMDLPRVEAWLRQPQVARWWTPDTTAEAKVSLYRLRVTGQEPTTHMLVVTEDDIDIGWCQWYHWADFPAEALALREQRTTRLGSTMRSASRDGPERG